MPTRREFLMRTATATFAAASPQVPEMAAGQPAPGVDGLRAGTAAAKVRKQSSTAPLKLALVGTGQIAPRYLNQVKESERARFVATCARTLESAKARAVEYGIGAWFDDHKKMYDIIKPDAVVIATPHTLHAEHSLAALERGIHVLCEKPMATSWDDCLAMVAASQKNGAILLNMPYDATPTFLTALENLNETTLGVFTGAEANLSLPGATRDGAYDDKHKGGAMFSTAVYPISRLVSLFGPARRVTGFVNTLIPHRLVGDGKTIDFTPPPRASTKRAISTVEDNVTLLIEWANGQHAVARSLWSTSFFGNTTTIYGRQGTMWISGENVIIHSPTRTNLAAEPVSWNGHTNCYKISVTNVRTNEGVIDHFVDCILGLAKPTCGGVQQLHVHEILFRGFEAARSGRTQDLTTTFIPWHPIDPSFHDTRSRFI